MKLTKTKRNQLILVLFGTAAVLALMWINLIRPRYTALSQSTAAEKRAGDKLAAIQNTIKHANAITAELTKDTQTLSNAETDMASGDLYAWTYNTIRLFNKPSYHVNIPDISHPDVGTMDLLPGFPFKQVNFTITGTAYYHDLGKFVADFENKFPHIRVVNLQMQPTDIASGNEKLAFKMNVVVLVKSTSS